MIESRLPGNERYWKSISRWIRDEMISTENCSEAFERLEYFCHDKRGMLDQYNSGGFITDTSTVADTSVSIQETSTTEYSHNKYPVIDLTLSPSSQSPSNNIPIFSDKRTLAAVQEGQTVDIDVSDTSTSSEHNITVKYENEDSKPSIDISSSPELFIEGEIEATIQELADKSINEISPPNLTLHLDDRRIFSSKINSSADDKRAHSPEETSNLVIKRRKVSRMQQHLNESSSENHSSYNSVSHASPSSAPSNSCPTCSNKLLKTRPSPDKTVKISDFIRGKYDIRALGKLQFTAFPDENSANSTLGNMGVFCTECSTVFGRVTFSIEDNSVGGIVQLE